MLHHRHDRGFELPTGQPVDGVQDLFVQLLVGIAAVLVSNRGVAALPVDFDARDLGQGGQLLGDELFTAAAGHAGDFQLPGGARRHCGDFVRD